jgi:hypothetical protein
MKIESYFSGIKNANIAVEKLKREGFTKAYSDINSHDSINNVVAKEGGVLNSSSLSGIVLSSSNTLYTTEQGPLAAASPMASGMGGFDEIADVNYKVIVDADEKEVIRAKQIIKELGGDLEDPNFKVPKGLENVSFEEVIDKLSQ